MAVNAQYPPTLSGMLRQIAERIDILAGVMAKGDYDYLHSVADDLDNDCASPEIVQDAIEIAREYDSQDRTEHNALDDAPISSTGGE